MIDTHTHLYSEEFDEEQSRNDSYAPLMKALPDFILPAIYFQNHTTKCFDFGAEFPNAKFSQ